MNVMNNEHLEDRIEEIISAEWDREAWARNAAMSIIEEFGLEVRRDNLSGNGYRVVGKWVED
jgi:hypothetical protein